MARATPAARPFGPAPTTIALLMPRLPLAPVLARSSLRSSLALGFGCSCHRPVIVILLVADATADLLAVSDHVTSVGIGPLGSHGCSATASVTFQVPRSITPSAASITL